MNRLLIPWLVLGLGLLPAGCDSEVDDDDAVDDDAVDDDDDSSADDDDTAPQDADGDGFDETEDCDDGDPNVHPGAEPLCDGVDDNDCDGIIDDNEMDTDGDGYSECDGDCNLNNPAVYPGAEQVCNDGTMDNDCDGYIDDNETDSDMDGYTDCEGDCDDTNAAILPGAWDVVDGLDNDCDGDGDEDVIDCDTVPTEPISETVLSGPRAYHGIAFDTDGYIYGSDGSSIVRSDYSGKNASTWSPNSGSGEQMVMMPDGDIAFINTNNGSVERIDPSGSRTYLGNRPNGAYGIIWGPDDMLWLAGGSSVWQMDPATGDTTEVVSGIQGTARTLAFNGDASLLYVGTQSSGNLYVIQMDASLQPIGAPQVLASVGGSYHDGLGVDVCGYIFVACYSTNNLYRVSPGGDVAVFADWNYTSYGHGLVWGSGYGGFRLDSLYVPMSYNNNQVKEVEVGVPHCSWGGTVYNAP